MCDSHPLQIYALAAAHSLEPLAIRVSTAVLSVPLTDIDPASASAMGAVYLLRLARLHQSRKDALKGLMLVAPKEHEDTPGCGRDERRSVMRAWALAAAYLAWEVVPNADQDWIMKGLSPLLGHVTCNLCERSLQMRMQTVLESWSKVKATIWNVPFPSRMWDAVNCSCCVPVVFSYCKSHTHLLSVQILWVLYTDWCSMLNPILKCHMSIYRRFKGPSFVCLSHDASCIGLDFKMDPFISFHFY
jgi:hypothetical protein